jgi:hypothetical protein
MPLSPVAEVECVADRDILNNHVEAAVTAISAPPTPSKAAAMRGTLDGPTTASMAEPSSARVNKRRNVP